MENIRIVDTAPAPGGRYRTDGPFSGEEFREDILIPALQKAKHEGSKVRVILDGAPGYGSSFLEECFGGLIRKGIIAKSDVGSVLEISANSPTYSYFLDLALRFVQRAESEANAAA